MTAAIAIVGSRVGLTGGVVAVAGQVRVRVAGALVAVQGATVSPHGAGPHAAATFRAAAGSPVVRIDGQPVLRAGDVATCVDAVQSPAPPRIPDVRVA